MNKMPLPDLLPNVESRRRNQAAFFDAIYLIAPEELILEKRIACLSPLGVNLLLQRWVHHNSRAVIPTHIYQEVTSPAYEEADLIEEWCEERLEVGVAVDDSATEAMKWLRQDVGAGATRQQFLQEPQRRSTVRKEMRSALRSLRTESQGPA